MFRDVLIEAGFTAELADKIVALHKKEIDGNFVPKVTFNAELEKVKAANAEIAKRDEQIAELGKFTGTVEQLQQQVTSLTTKNENDRREYEEKLKRQTEDFALTSYLSDKVYNPDDVISKLDRSKLVFSEGKVVAGLVEQMAAIKNVSPHYFKPEDTSKQMFQPWGNTPAAGSSNIGGGTSELTPEKFAEILASGFSGGAESGASEKYYFGGK